MASGWQGAAWLVFKMAAAGRAVPAYVLEAVRPRLVAELARSIAHSRVGALIGCSADAVVAAYAARLGIVALGLARTANKRAVAAARRSPAWDVQLGVGGTLLACAEINAIEPRALRGVRLRPLATRLLAHLDALCEVPLGWPTGMAHGLAGGIVAAETAGALGWCRVTHRHRQRWLDALARSALARGDALLWPARAGDRELGLQSWCAGTPGVALAALQSFRLTREPAYLNVARGALAGMQMRARYAFPSRTLCCGTAGLRHIFIEAYCVTGDLGWLRDGARELRLARTASPWSHRNLLQGELGVAYLADRLAEPRAFPLPALGVASA